MYTEIISVAYPRRQLASHKCEPKKDKSRCQTVNALLILVPSAHFKWPFAFRREALDMGDEDDLKEAIRENAKGPAKAAGDSGSIEQHPLRD